MDCTDAVKYLRRQRVILGGGGVYAPTDALRKHRPRRRGPASPAVFRYGPNVVDTPTYRWFTRRKFARQNATDRQQAAM